MWNKPEKKIYLHNQNVFIVFPFCLHSPWWCWNSSARRLLRAHAARRKLRAQAARLKLRAQAARQKLCAHAARTFCARMGYFQIWIWNKSEMKEYDLYSSGFLIVYILLDDTQILLRVENCARISARRKLRAHGLLFRFESGINLKWKNMTYTL